MYFIIRDLALLPGPQFLAIAKKISENDSADGTARGGCEGKFHIKSHNRSDAWPFSVAKLSDWVVKLLHVKPT